MKHLPNQEPSHDHWREWLALRLYGELDDSENGILEAHLGTCGECAAFAIELEEGLGRARSAVDQEELALSSDWRDAVVRRIAAEEPAGGTGRPRSAPVLLAWRGLATLAAGFLLGLLATRALAPIPSGGADGRPGSGAESAPLETAHLPPDQPLPPARTTSRFARVRPYLGR